MDKKTVIKVLLLILIVGLSSCEVSINPKPVFRLLDHNSDYVDNNSEYNIGEEYLNNNKKLVFQIENIGHTNLLLTGEPLIVFSGTGASAFSIYKAPESTIKIGEICEFTIDFTPDVLGTYKVTVKIISNDPNCGVFSFDILANGVVSDIEILVSDTNEIIIHNGTYDLGSSLFNTSIFETFTIKNNGSGDLILLDTPSIDISGTNSDRFYLVMFPNPTIPPGGSTTFRIEFNPTQEIDYYAKITIENNVSGKNPFKFTITGAGIKPEPDITVTYNSNDIPNSTGICKFPGTMIGTSNIIEIFIKNDGDADLQLVGNKPITISGTDSSLFKLNTIALNNTIPVGVKTSFKITFKPLTPGLKSASVSIENNDPDENPFVFTLLGDSNSESDFNGDGIQDMIIGAKYDDAGGTTSGSAFIFFGKQSWSSSLYSSNADVKLIGENEGDVFGCCVSSIGDVNGDGYDDLAVGAYYNDEGGEKAGSVYLFFGKQNWNSTIDASNADVKLIGMDAGDLFGISISKAMNINKDDYNDVIVGAMNDDDGGSASGCVFIFYGRQSWSSSIDASNASVRIIGESSGDIFGNVLSYAGDLNGDNFDDLIVGAQHDDDGGSNAGCASIFFGKSSMSSMIDASNADVKLIGEDSADCFGASVSYVGDVNDDGYDDVIVGAYRDKDKGFESGCAFIFFGRQNWPSSIDASNASIKFTGSNDDDRLGYSVTYASDLNNDGIDDVVISAPEDDDGGNSTGCVFIYWGKKNWSTLYDASNCDVKIVGQNILDRIGMYLSSAGDINKDGFDDLIICAQYRKITTYNEGCVYIFYGKQSWNSTISSSLADIEIKGTDEHIQFGSSASGN